MKPGNGKEYVVSPLVIMSKRRGPQMYCGISLPPYGVIKFSLSWYHTWEVTRWYIFVSRDIMPVI